MLLWTLNYHLYKKIGYRLICSAKFLDGRHELPNLLDNFLRNCLRVPGFVRHFSISILTAYMHYVIMQK